MDQSTLIGRKEEQQILRAALTSRRAEMISVIGRRRVGKTFLVESTYKSKIDFRVTGVQYATRKEQLRNFMIQLTEFSKGKMPFVEISNWMDAFYMLSKFLESKKKSQKLIVFLDELPWLASHRSGFLKGLSFFWNSWAVRKNIVLVICGSAASWMIKKVVHHRGGLHNRITRSILLKPFTLAETEAFFKAKKIKFDRYQLLHLYMALGGVPHYLEAVEFANGAAQNINQLCFSQNGLLVDEFSKLYHSLFENADNHIKVVRGLAKKRIGLTRAEIIATTGLLDGGGTSKVLEELIHSGFVTKYFPFGKLKKESLFRLTDEYSLFYLHFVERNKREGKNIWQQIIQTPKYSSWAGYSFENICLKHLPQIKQALGIGVIYSTSSSFFRKGNAENEGVQIDLLIDRNDNIINICEMKFYKAEISISKAMAKNLRKKVALFEQYSKTKKMTLLTLVTTFGINENQHSSGLIDHAITMDALFEKV